MQGKGSSYGGKGGGGKGKGGGMMGSYGSMMGMSSGMMSSYGGKGKGKGYSSPEKGKGKGKGKGKVSVPFLRISKLLMVLDSHIILNCSGQRKATKAYSGDDRIADSSSARLHCPYLSRR
jgi:hypothetical protein